MKKLIPILFLGAGLALMSLTYSAPVSHSAAVADSLAEYTGTYKMIDNGYFSEFKVTSKDGFLYGEADQNGANKLLKQEKPDTFKSTSQYGSVITFKRNAETKKITGLSLLIQDTELKAEKQ
ncbi:MAG: DUF3471 domain-containing protein [Spirosomataceae bacterium]